MRPHPDIFKLLNSLNYPVFMQGSMSTDFPYPDRFITYYWFSSADIWRFNNEATATTYTCQVTIYAALPSLMDEVLAKVIDLLLKNGYTKSDGGRMVPSDEPSHIGWSIDFNYIVTD